MRVLIVVLAFSALLAGRALAQVSLGDGGSKTPMELLSDAEDKRRAQDDKDYQAVMKRTRGNTPAAAASSDPWGSVRQAPATPNKK
jgi:hypothetical protein